MPTPHRLVCIVEGDGDVEAVPQLCNQIFAWLGAKLWFADKRAIRCPRGKLVDMTVKSPARPCKPIEVARYLALASDARPDAILVLCDADDDCPDPWATSLARLYCKVPVAAVMAVREYESWLLWTLDPSVLTDARVDPERVRDAKGTLARIDRAYQPSIHQLPRTRALDIKHVTARSRSFNKLVRELARLCGRPAPKPLHFTSKPASKKARR